MKSTKSIFFVTTIMICVVWSFFAVPVFADDNKIEKLSEYMRISTQEGKIYPISFDVPIVKFKNKKNGVEVTLIGAIHIADKKYYEELNEEFKKYESVLFEAVIDTSKNKNKNKKNIIDKKDIKDIFEQKNKKPNNEFITEILDLTHQMDHINYLADNMVHADLTLDEFIRRELAREDIFISFIINSLSGMKEDNLSNALDLQGRLIGSLLASNPALSLKRNIARMFTSEILTDLSLPKEGSVIITERNAAALKVLRKEIKKGTKKIAIFYGCAHLPEFAASLKKDFKMEKIETKWITAWNLTKKKSKEKK
ncbi:MAG: hypothetical protein LBE18_04365 [Planctomycetaceae bacterium]|jgi:hypothetical protein|nr:hypothetical protein [Planctomycetaceae bacterium]